MVGEREEGVGEGREGEGRIGTAGPAGKGMEEEVGRGLGK